MSNITLTHFSKSRIILIRLLTVYRLKNDDELSVKVVTSTKQDNFFSQNYGILILLNFEGNK